MYHHVQIPQTFRNKCEISKLKIDTYNSPYVKKKKRTCFIGKYMYSKHIELSPRTSMANEWQWLLLSQQFSSGGGFAPRGYLSVPRDIFGCYDWGGEGDATCTQYVEARNAAKHLQCISHPPLAKDYPVSDVNSTKAENPRCSRYTKKRSES